ncbi:MAG TPA: hypothetical protein VMI54_14335 [Polyangiaceae bacterium]|nr:hypothetical protein [Polyangiaceae bacterium]
MAATSCGTSPGPASTPPDCKAGLPTKDACATNAPSYATDIAPLVEARCLGCHFKGNPNSSVVLETQAEMSQQTQLVETQIYRCEMPPADGGIPLTDTERTELLQWLVCGAPNN